MMKNPTKQWFFLVPTARLARQLMPLRQNFPPHKVPRLRRSAISAFTLPRSAEQREER
jgi:hypothetical protein